tara:strand:- start:62 stop:682 length:621 start_codon:yes stop_codon:yes gene_type:complete
MMDKPSYYAIIPANVRYNNEIKPNAKLLYGEITCLSNNEGFCWAMNQYFAELYEVDKKTISRWIGQLKKFGYIDVQVNYREGTKQIKSRYIKLTTPRDEIVPTLGTKLSLPRDEIVTVNSTSNNITSVFKTPSIQMVAEYCNSRQNKVDAETFIDFYASKNWMIGKNKMSNWKACVRTWEKTEKANANKRSGKSSAAWTNPNPDNF